MNDKSLEKNLANLERELLALQTAHDVGLGAVGFYEYSYDAQSFFYNYGQFFILMIDVLEGEREDPLMNVFISSIYETNDVGFAMINRENSMKFLAVIIRPFYYTAVNMSYKVVSSSKLNVKAATSFQEYEDWLNG